MANVRIIPALERAKEELQAAFKQIQMYSGIDKDKAMKVDDLATSIADMASDIAGLARQVQGDTSGGRVNKNVRKALGFTSP
jgi:hypothetical protein